MGPIFQHKPITTQNKSVDSNLIPVGYKSALHKHIFKIYYMVMSYLTKNYMFVLKNPNTF